MKFSEIEKVFTDKVSEFLEKGYVISTATALGSEREYSKIDLRKGDDLVRIFILKEFEHRRWRDDFDFETENWFPEFISVIVSHMDLSEFDNKEFRYDETHIFWNSDFEVEEKISFTEIDKNWYLPKGDDISEINRKHGARLLLASERAQNRTIVFPEKFNPVLLKIARKLAGMKRVRVDEVSGYKRFDSLIDKYTYFVKARGKEINFY